MLDDAAPPEEDEPLAELLEDELEDPDDPDDPDDPEAEAVDDVVEAVDDVVEAVDSPVLSVAVCEAVSQAATKKATATSAIRRCNMVMLPVLVRRNCMPGFQLVV